jgi:hypothetical protein
MVREGSGNIVCVRVRGSMVREVSGSMVCVRVRGSMVREGSGSMVCVRVRGSKERKERKLSKNNGLLSSGNTPRNCICPF